VMPLPRRLPALANNCFVVGEAKRADVIWSEGDFLALCEHMLNGNPPDHFLAAWIDSESGQARFAKARRSRADKRARWAWATITGKAKAQTSIGFYPSNAERKSRWAAIDFDAHNGEHEQARKRSLEAFSLLLQNPELHLILCASGNGYHLFIYTRELHPVSRWIVLLKQACEWIGVPVTDGTCEIFPNERAESHRVGKGIRAPGTLNPKTGTVSLIEAATIKPLLETLPRTWSNGVGKVTCARLGNSNTLSLQKSTNTYSLSTRPLIEGLLLHYPVQRKGTRNGILMNLIGDLVHKFGREISQRIVKEHYERYQGQIGTPLDEHMRDFTTGWNGLVSKIVESLSPAEANRFDTLRSEHQREGFLIVRAFAGAAEHKGNKEFEISQSSLADRLNITPPGAADVIRKLCELKVIAQTQGYVRHKKSAQFCWLLPRGRHKGNGITLSAQCRSQPESRGELAHRPRSAPREALPARRRMEDLNFRRRTSCATQDF